MLTTSEIAVTAAIWSLTAAGGFFGIRATLRKKRAPTPPETGQGTQDTIKQS